MVDAKWIETNKNEVLQYLETTINGLSEEEAKNRLKRYGYNIIKRHKEKNILSIFIEQFKSPLIYLLLLAALISLVSGELTDTYVILFILLINAFIGSYHELSAKNSIKSLEKLVEGEVKVVRDGNVKIISSSKIVPGDIVLFSEGDKVIADCRIIEQHGLKVDESSLTGESISVEKTDLPVSASRISEMKNMLFASTFVVSGRVKAVVINTGNNTEMGKIYEKIKKSEAFPIKKKLDTLTKNLSKYVFIGFVAISALSILLFKYDPSYILELLLAQSVSFIPEGLPIVVTIAMAISAYDMAKRKAVIKKLEAMEAIGAIDYLCIDKTGTVTENKIKLSLFSSGNKIYEIKDAVYLNSKIVYPLEYKNLITAFEAISLCNKVEVVDGKPVGDPIEVAIYNALDSLGFLSNVKVLKQTRPQIYEIPFNSENKFMLTLNKDLTSKKYIKSIKGAPEKIISSSKFFLDEEGKLSKLTDSKKKYLLKEVERYAERGYRTLGVAYSESNKKDVNLKDLIFLGILYFEDPVRESASFAIKELEKAGIKILMITGDHKLTAKAVARKIGLKGKVFEEDELFSLPKEEVEKNLHSLSVISRASIEGKMRMIKLLREKGYKVAMTGDGINDALALKEAEVGISLASATDVAKEASDIILLDDNIENIYNAIEQGRRSIINIKKTIRYLFSTNASEVFFLLSFLFSPLFSPGIKFPLTATQILYVNLVTDGLCDVAIATEKKEKELSRHKPSYFKRDYFSKEVKNFILISSVMSFFILFAVFFMYENSSELATMIFTTLAFIQLFTALTARRIYQAFSYPNKFLLIALILSILTQLFVIYNPFLSEMLNVVPLSLVDWIIVLLFSSTIFFVHEMAKKRKITI